MRPMTVRHRMPSSPINKFSRMSREDVAELILSSPLRLVAIEQADRPARHADGCIARQWPAAKALMPSSSSIK